MSIEQLYRLFLKYPSVQTDTRKLQKGDIFFALKGPNFNANEFAHKALEQGAAYAVIDDSVYAIDERMILVDDVLTCLQQLAKHHRKQFNIPVLAITGSNGKTTTKELVSSVLSAHYHTCTTKGNLNNHIGVPLTLLSIQPNAEIAIIEMGANHQKEIESYCNYTLPTHGIITNCGKAHLEGFGGVEGVKKGKGELYDYLRDHQGTIFLFADYDYLIPMSKGIHQIIKYGTTDGEIQGNVIASEPFLQVALTKGVSFSSLQTQLVGNYNLSNVLCAVAIGKHFNVPDAAIKNAIESYQPSNSRSQMLVQATNHIILDAYNANPSSMKAAIENFAAMQVPKKILMLGAMMELGEESIQEHKAIVELINQYKWEEVVLVGGDYAKINHSYLFFNNSSEAKNWFVDKKWEQAHILVKGSRSMQMEKIVQE